MTDHERDELLQALLDGEASAADAARVDADPELAARLAALTAVRDDLADAPAAPAGLLDAQIAAALDVYDDHVAHPSTDRAVAPVTALADRRPPLLARTWAQAAAVLVVVAFFGGVVALLASSEGDDTDTTAAATDDAREADTLDDAATEEAGTADGDDGFAPASGGGDAGAAESAPVDEELAADTDAAATTSTGPFSTVSDLDDAPRSDEVQYGGTVIAADLDELADQVQAALGRPDPTASSSPPPPAPDCEIWVQAQDRALRYEADADVDGRALRVLVVRADPGDEYVVVDLVVCEVVDERTL